MMKYCTNCGSPLNAGAKFCASCGAKIQSRETDTSESFNEKPIHPRREDSFTEKSEEFLKQKTKEVIEEIEDPTEEMENPYDKIPFDDYDSRMEEYYAEHAEEIEAYEAAQAAKKAKMAKKTGNNPAYVKDNHRSYAPETDKKKRKKLGLWTMVYLIISILFLFLPSSHEKNGLLFFSFVILLIAVIRNKEEKPFNTILKIIIGIQMVFLLALIIGSFGVGDFVIPIIFLLALLFADLMLILKGNSGKTDYNISIGNKKVY